MIVVVEGDTDLPYIRKLVIEAGFAEYTAIDAAGCGNIDRDLDKYNEMAKGMPIVVLRDLDNSAPCGAALVQKLVPNPSRGLCLRIAVRELESWVMADASGFSRFTGIDEKWLPANPDAEKDPTLALIKVAAHAPARIRRMLLPAKGSSAIVGPLYEAKLIEFGERGWSPIRAAKRSPSLKRARQALSALARNWPAFLA